MYITGILSPLALASEMTAKETLPFLHTIIIVALAHVTWVRKIKKGLPGSTPSPIQPQGLATDVTSMSRYLYGDSDSL
jgi:hypothetical protein